MLPVEPILILILSSLTILLLINSKKHSWARGDEYLANLKEKGWETLHKSIAKSQDMLGQAELEGIKVVASSKFNTQRMEEQYGEDLSEIIRQSQAAVNQAYLQVVEFMNNLKKTTQQTQQESEKMTQARVNELFDKLEQRLSDFLIESSQKTSTSLELELKATRALIETYKQEQLKLIDENILAMMEQTLAIVLNKKLSLEDHLDLIYESLEKAKVEKFIV